MGVTRSQWWTLTNIYYHSGITQMQLASILDIGKSATGKLLSKLEDKGWIERRPDQSDGRAYNVYLTEDITPIVEKMVDLCVAITSTPLAGLSESENKHLYRLLTKLRKGFSARGAESQARIDALKNELQSRADGKKLRRPRATASGGER